ncbi:hypothetical protein Pcinc_025391 [Petrolisthes cinctipes]|uniref:CCHC-type domain-containing protein n=1 Tax=Petrolisthes cinctipes TaxID=88211 RepID=A0AAE1F9Z5_PETCI|nr:hypothetical protein Pcinc_025391 [Petrolisthes cinctipes]
MEECKKLTEEHNSYQTWDVSWTLKARKLASLRKYSRGRAALAVKSTSDKSPEEGYKRALEMLEKRFDNPYISPVGGWMKTNHEIRSRYKRGAEITDLVQFINDAADEAPDPVFGSLVSRDQKRDKGRIQQSTPQKRQFGIFPANTSVTEGNAIISETRKQTGGKCPCSGQGHNSIHCSQFRALKIKDCWNLVMSKGLCVNCFAMGHQRKDCSRSFICTVEGCGMKHSKYLHLPNRRPYGNDTTPETATQMPGAATLKVNDAPRDLSVIPRVSNFVSNQCGKLALPIVPAKVRCLDTSTIIDTCHVGPKD